MKTRDGFISNSSSSSFVFLGVKLNYLDWADGFKLDGLDGRYFENVGYLVGKQLASWDGNSSEDFMTDVDISGIHKMSNEIVSKLEPFVPEKTKLEIKLYFGMVYS